MNEVPILQELLRDKEWVEKNLEEDVTKFNKIEHTTKNFIDNSNSIIEFDDPTDANYYLDRYMKVLKIFYNHSKHKINTDKTALLVISKPKHKDIKEEIRIEDEVEEMKPKPQICMLGWHINERIKMDTNINIAIGIIHKIINNLQLIKNLMHLETRKMVATSMILSKMS